MSHSITLLISDKRHTAPAVTHHDEDGQPQDVLMFDAAYDVLEAWRQRDLDHRKFGWTSDDTEPETAFAAWVDAAGVLRIVYLDPFFDGVGTTNGYAVSELTQLPFVTTGGDPA